MTNELSNVTIKSTDQIKKVNWYIYKNVSKKKERLRELWISKNTISL